MKKRTEVEKRLVVIRGVCACGVCTCMAKDMGVVIYWSQRILMKLEMFGYFDCGGYTSLHVRKIEQTHTHMHMHMQK